MTDHTPAQPDTRIEFQTPTRALTYLPFNNADTDALHETMLSTFGQNEDATDAFAPGELPGDMTVTVHLSDQTFSTTLAEYAPVIAASLDLDSPASRLAFWDWAMNLGTNAPKIGAADQIRKAFENALQAETQNLAQFGREYVEDKGDSVSRALAQYVDWAAFLREEHDLAVVAVPNGFVIYDTTA